MPYFLRGLDVLLAGRAAAERKFVELFFLRGVAVEDFSRVHGEFDRANTAAWAARRWNHGPASTRSK